MLVVLAICLGLVVGQDTKPDAVGTCGGKFTGKNGRIASPGYPHSQYNNDLKCQYVIEVDPGYVIAYSSIYMNVEPPFAGSCFDWVSIYKDADVSGKADSYCGDVIIPNDVSTGSRLIVEFRSDVSLAGNGFVLAWAALDLKSMPEIFDCDFNGPLGLCPGWTQAQQDMFDWNIKRGRTIDSFTGPDEDHSTGSHLGRYAYMEAEGQQQNDAAILVSPPTTLDYRPEYCMRFWYQNYGTSNAILFVVLIQSDGKGRYIFSSRQNQRRGWREGQITLEGGTESVQIAFEARRGVSSYSDVALDDISLRPGACPEPRISTMPPTTTTITTTASTTTKAVHPACEANKVYQDCVPACDTTCDAYKNGITCGNECIARCACPAHLPLWLENRCLPIEFCPTIPSPTTTETTTSREPGAQWVARHYAQLVRSRGADEAFSLYIQLVALYNAWMESHQTQQ